MFTIDNKFNIGEEVYLIHQVPIKYNCPVCQGKGEFNYNGHDIRCPKCNGHGKLHDNKAKIWEVMDNTYKISTIKVSYNGNDVHVRYKVSGYNRAESNIFQSYEDAKDQCHKLNYMDISKPSKLIVIK